MRITPFVLLAGCDLLFPPSDDTGIDDEALIDAELGGSVASADGVLVVTIPPGALAADTSVSVRALDVAEWPAGVADYEPLSPVYTLEPDGTEFLVPVEFTWTFDAPPAGMIDEEGGVALVLGASHSAGEFALHDEVVLDLPPDGTAVVVSATTHFSQHWLSNRFANESVLRRVGHVRLAMAGGRRAVDQRWPLGGILFESGFQASDGTIFVHRIGIPPVAPVPSAEWDPHHDAPVALSPGQEWSPTSLPDWTCNAAGIGEQQLGFQIIVDSLDINTMATRRERIECVDQDDKVEYQEELAELGPRVAALPVPGNAAVALSESDDAWGFTVDIPPGDARRGADLTGTVEVCPVASGGSVGVMYYPKYGPGFDFLDIDGCTRVTNRDPDLPNNVLVVLTGTADVEISAAYVD